MSGVAQAINAKHGVMGSVFNCYYDIDPFCEKQK